MTLRHLEIFLEVCREESITKAAVTLNMAQPGVSSAIRELEEEYKTRLFERMNRRLYITETGEQLRAYADSILEQIRESHESIWNIEHMTKIRIGSNISCGCNLLPGLMEEFTDQNPSIPLYLTVEKSGDIEEKLLKNELDFGFIDEPLQSEYFIRHKIQEDEMVAVGASRFFQVRQMEVPTQITAEELSRLPLLLREKGSGSRAKVDTMFLSKSLVPDIRMESTNINSLIELCRTGFGLLILPLSMLRFYGETSSLHLIRLTDTRLVREYGLVYHKSKFLTKSMLVFRDYVLNLGE